MNQQQLRMLQQMIQAQQRNSDGLLSFKAGRMDYDPVSKLVTATKGPGKIKWFKSDQGYLKIQWISRINNEVKFDRMIFPNTATVAMVPECKDGRVFVLKMTDSKQRIFFWLQEPSDEKDKEYIEKMTKLCKGQSIGNDNANANPLLSSLTGQNGGRGGLNRQQLQQQMQMQQLMGLGGLGGQTSGQQILSEEQQMQMAIQQSLMGTGNSRNSSNNNRSQNNTSNLNNNNISDFSRLILEALNNPNFGSNNNNIRNNNNNNNLMEEMKRQHEQMMKEPDLTDLLDVSSNNEITELLDDEKVVEILSEHLPDEMKSKQDIIEHLESPQFRSALVRLQHVVNSPQLTLILGQMGLSSDKFMGVNAFLQAIIKGKGKKDENKNDNKNENNNNNSNNSDSNNNNNDTNNNKDDNQSNNNNENNNINENKDKQDNNENNDNNNDNNNNDNDTQMTDKS